MAVDHDDVEIHEKDDENKEKSKSKSSSSKSKDLSHVPCKFYRVGSCTAGSSCPFSHQSPSSSSGAQKDTCAWFVKGNCKFGHKCALAHILPGQGMAMDRKNKKAAQLMAAATGQQGLQPQGPNRSKQNRTGGKDHGSGPSSVAASPGGGAGTRNPLLSGSTAPTRSVHSTGGPPPRMPNLKATISPSAPAPPLKDTDFASFGLDVDDNPIQKLPSAPALPQAKASPVQDPRVIEDGNEEKKEEQQEVVDTTKNKEKPFAETTLTSPLPLSTPSAARRTHIPSRPSRDFGPIGSPPRSSPHITHLNGFSPSASPSGGFGVTSPFSAPGNTQTMYTLSSPPNSNSTSDFKTRSGLAASLGATRGGWTDFGPVPSQVLSASVNTREIAVEDEDLEEFVPSSLSELLSPSEHSRRMSRTHSGQQRPSSNHHHNSGIGIGSSVLNDGSGGTRHHYSRSVPAPSLLGDIASIWAPSDANTSSQLPASSGLGLGIGSSHIGGTPSSFKSSNNTFGGRSLDLLGEGGGEPNPSLLSPSNASAAFLPGLHHHYLNRSGMGGVQRSISGGDNRASGLGTSPGTLHAHSNFSSGFGSRSNGNGSGLDSTTFSPPRLNAFGSRPPFSSHDSQHLPSSSSQLHSTQDSSAYYPNRAQPIPADSHTALYSNPQAAISPSARALQAHAPGQSLPQGLAAGYSRIHALPPLPNLPSPAFNGVGSPGTGGGVSGSPGVNHNMEWLGLGKAPEQSHPPLSSNSNSGPSTGLESMFSRLSYSAVATSSSRSSQHSNLSMTSSSSAAAAAPTGTAISPMTMRNSSGGKNWPSGAGGPLSPLSGPVVTGDDDDLFSMDG